MKMVLLANTSQGSLSQRLELDLGLKITKRKIYADLHRFFWYFDCFLPIRFQSLPTPRFILRKIAKELSLLLATTLGFHSEFSWSGMDGS